MIDRLPSIMWHYGDATYRPIEHGEVLDVRYKQTLSFLLSANL